jgi:hypothetical protein
VRQPVQRFEIDRDGRIVVVVGKPHRVAGLGLFSDAWL